jgi:serine/threonine protein kinase
MFIDYNLAQAHVLIQNKIISQDEVTTLCQSAEEAQVDLITYLFRQDRLTNEQLQKLKQQIHLANETPTVKEGDLAVRSKASKNLMNSHHTLKGQSIDHFEVIEEISRGGMGIVYRARDRTLDREVALKLILDPSAELEMHSRFEREARALARLDHPNVIDIYHFGYFEGHPYYVMKLIVGETLCQCVQDRAHDLERGVDLDWITEIFETVTRAIGYCHSRGLIHRDLKPQNILLDSASGQPIVIDFGLAKKELTVSTEGPSESAAGHQTATGVGTPRFMAPEQADRSFGAIGPKTDVWGLGTTFYDCLTGQTPFQGQAMISVLHALMTEEAPKVSAINGNIPQWLVDLIAACLDKDVDKRPTIQDLLDSFEARRFKAGQDYKEEAGGHLQRRNFRTPALLTFGSIILVSTLWLLLSPSSKRAVLETGKAAEVKAPDLSILLDRSSWSQASHGAQDAVIQEIAAQLASEFKYLKTMTYSVGSKPGVHSSYRIATFVHVKTEAEMNLIPGGFYLMGTRDAAQELRFCQTFYKGSNRNIQRELPQHKVFIKPMLVGRYEVRKAEWERGGQVRPTLKDPDLPVSPLNWVEVQRWLKKVKLRLPSEAEWEYASRAPDPYKSLNQSQPRYFWGDEFNAQYCWNVVNSRKKLQPVTAHSDRSNAFGLVDTLGNVWEWCQDTWVEDYSHLSSDHRAQTGSSPKRAVRGGSVDNFGCDCRCAYRIGLKKTTRNFRTGLRLWRSLEEIGRR